MAESLLAPINGGGDAAAPEVAQWLTEADLPLGAAGGGGPANPPLSFHVAFEGSCGSGCRCSKESGLATLTVRSDRLTLAIDGGWAVTWPLQGGARAGAPKHARKKLGAVPFLQLRVDFSPLECMSATGPAELRWGKLVLAFSELEDKEALQALLEQTRAAKNALSFEEVQLDDSEFDAAPRPHCTSLNPLELGATMRFSAGSEEASAGLLSATLSTTRSPFYQYKLTLTVTPGGARCFKLRDRCFDCYELGCSFGTTHVVRFNSRSPNIIGVECRVGKWSGGQRAAVAVALPLVACAAVAPIPAVRVAVAVLLLSPVGA